MAQESSGGEQMIKSTFTRADKLQSNTKSTMLFSLFVVALIQDVW